MPEAQEAATAEEQASVTAEVSSSITNINKIADKTTDSIHAIISSSG